MTVPLCLWAGLVVGASLLAQTAPAPGVLEARVALVIGNAAYPGAVLANPLNDAKAMTRFLQGAGFEVVERLDATRESMQAALATAAGRMTGRQAMAVFYYAGHGIQVDWRNYLIPVDASPSSAAEARATTLDLGTVVEAFRKAGSRRIILVLDACRDNPFRQATTGSGLAPMDAPAGTLLAYATAPGHVADDGSLGNGLYTGYLLEELARPGTRIEDILKRVRLGVRRDSSGRQIPWESTSLEDDFYFLPGKGEPLTDSERDARLDQQVAQWGQVEKSNSPESLITFLASHPSGPFSELAQFRLDQMQKVTVQPQARPGSVPVLPSGTNRFRVGDILEYQETWKAPNRFRGRVVYEVLKASDDRVDLKVSFLRPDGQVKVVKQQSWDQLGNLLSDNTGARRSLPWVQVPADLSLGKRWISEFWLVPEEVSKLRRRRISWDLRVVGQESVEGPQGNVLAFRVEGVSKTSVHSPGGTTYWVDPATFIKVRETTWRKDASDHPTIDVHRELLSYRRAGEVKR